MLILGADVYVADVIQQNFVYIKCIGRFFFGVVVFLIPFHLNWLPLTFDRFNYLQLES